MRSILDFIKDNDWITPNTGIIPNTDAPQIYAIPSGTVLYGKNEILLSVKGSNRRGLVSRIGNIGIDVVFNGDLDVLKKSGNVPGALTTAGGGKGGDASNANSSSRKSVKKGGRK